MQLQNLLASVLSLSTLASAAPSNYADLDARQVPSGPCSHSTGGVHVIATPGAGNADPPYGLLSTLAASILQRIPGSTNVSVPYNHREPNGVLQAQQAAGNLSQYITDYHNSCPATKIVLIGYSSGGIGTMNVLCGESSPPYSVATQPLSPYTYGNTVIAAIAYGEETRVANQRYDYGTCKNDSPHPRSNPQGCDAWQYKIRSYCDSDDPFCCNGGTDKEVHYSYAMKYDQTATDFVARMLRYAGGA